MFKNLFGASDKATPAAKSDITPGQEGEHGVVNGMSEEARAKLLEQSRKALNEVLSNRSVTHVLGSKAVEAVPQEGKFEGKVAPMTIEVYGVDGKVGITDAISGALKEGFAHPFYLTRVICVAPAEFGKIVYEEMTLQGLCEANVDAIVAGNYLYMPEFEHIILDQREDKTRPNGCLFVGTKNPDDAVGIIKSREDRMAEQR